MNIIIKDIKDYKRSIIKDLNGKEIFETFYRKELQKTNQKEFRTKKVIKEKK